MDQRSSDPAPPDSREDAPSGDASEREKFVYAEAAELFTHGGMIARTRPAQDASAGNSNAPVKMQRRSGVTYRRFASGAEAVRFAIEELPAQHLLASVLVVNDDRYEGAAIKDLYTSPDYPLARASADRPAETERPPTALRGTRQ
jgi:hypothetical protein